MDTRRWLVVFGDIARELGRWEEGESNPLLDQAFGEWRGQSAQQTAMDIAPYRLDTTKALHTGAGVQFPEDVKRMINDTTQMVYQDFPELKKNISKIAIEPVPNGSVGLCVPNICRSEIKLDNIVFSSMANIMEVVKESVSTGHIPFAAGPSHLLLHEMGHALINTLAMDGVNMLNYAWKQSQGYSFDAAKNRVFAEINDLLIKSGIYSPDVQKRLGYRAQYNNDELVAQSMACVYNGSGDKGIAQIVLDYFKERLR